MMTIPVFLQCCLILVSGMGLAAADESAAQDGGADRGKERVGRIMATLYIGTDAELSRLGEQAKKAPEPGAEVVKRLQSVEKLRFKHYRLLGKDTQSVFRSYENWLSPLKPSEEILLSYESRGRSPDGGLRLDLEFWQHRRKVMKSDPVLHKGRPLLILGPKWRGGTLIIAVELLELKKTL
ncbi:hypothetical protein [Oceaniferula marina]|uniref:hypothetical protein n=1 Tax=Oceaniferula marina TaxID=2748318 RepID=UPI001D04072C|nr:hypothetical protein [Oceaniferula marina]